MLKIQLFLNICSSKWRQAKSLLCVIPSDTTPHLLFSYFIFNLKLFIISSSVFIFYFQYKIIDYFIFCFIFYFQYKIIYYFIFCCLVFFGDERSDCFPDGNSAYFQLYHDENKLLFNEMMMSVLEPTVYRTRGQHADHNTNDAVLKFLDNCIWQNQAHFANLHTTAILNQNGRHRSTKQ